MKQFWKILKFELTGYLRNKLFIGVTLFLVVAIAAVLFFPQIASFWESEDPSDGAGDEAATGEEEERPVMLLFAREGDASPLLPAFKSAFPQYTVTLFAGSAEEGKEKILAEEADCAIELRGLTAYTYYVGNLSLYDSVPETAEGLLQAAYRESALLQSGVSAERAQEILSTRVEGETVPLGKDQMQNFFYTYLMIFALYMGILLYGQMVATNVASEKSSRAMELLITSAKPTSMMFGKVLASCTAGLSQLVIVFGAALCFYRINRASFAENGIIASIFNIPLDLFVYLLIFFLLGFLIYAFLYGAIGSTASKLEDINTSVLPITFLFIIAFFVVVFSMTSGEVDSPLMRVCSFLPFTSPMAMFTRICMSTVPFWEIALSIAILIASTVGVGFLSARIYRVGVLLYGKKPKLSSLLWEIWRA